MLEAIKHINTRLLIAILITTCIGMYFIVQVNRYAYDKTGLGRTDKITGTVYVWNIDDRTWHEFNKPLDK